VALAAAARAGGAPAAGAGLPADVGRRAAAVVARLRAEAEGTRRVDLSGGRVAEVAYGEVRVWATPPSAAPAPAGAPSPVAIAGPGSYPWLGSTTVVVSAVDPARGRAATATCFDVDALRWPLKVRTRRAGDRMCPRGGRGSRKLSDLLIDAKVPRGERARMPVVTTADDVVLYVPGLRLADCGRPTGATTRLVRLVWQAAHTSSQSGGDGKIVPVPARSV
jgi:tRNA(Ile)-lysidine synthase